jgi:hypothetical protein
MLSARTRFKLNESYSVIYLEEAATLSNSIGTRDSNPRADGIVHRLLGKLRHINFCTSNNSLGK